EGAILLGTGDDPGAPIRVARPLERSGARFGGKSDRHLQHDLAEGIRWDVACRVRQGLSRVRIGVEEELAGHRVLDNVSDLLDRVPPPRRGGHAEFLLDDLVREEKPFGPSMQDPEHDGPLDALDADAPILSCGSEMGELWKYLGFSAEDRSP